MPHVRAASDRMRSRGEQQPIQLRLDLPLPEQLDKHPGQMLRLPINPDDIGAGLLSIVSQGLYTNPLDCIREYVQNAVDAQATRVTIKITGNTVVITDDGKGMDLAGLLQARQVGLSSKTLAAHVGFRGIGIYSGFGLCNTLRITTSMAGDPYHNMLAFDFAGMRARLDQDRLHATKRSILPDTEPRDESEGDDIEGADGDTQQAAPPRRVSLIELLSTFTQIGRMLAVEKPKPQFTQVLLQDISNDHIRLLSDRAEMHRYLLQNLPIDFDDTFEHKGAINTQLRAHVPGYNAIVIILQSDGIKDETVAKGALPNLQPPLTGYISTTTGQNVAYYWACMTASQGRVQPNRQQRDKDALQVAADYEGFVYKVKGFTVGDRSKLREAFQRKPQLYPWYTGEIYVLDENVIPDSGRHDFEANQAKVALELAVNQTLKTLEEKVTTYQAVQVAKERLDRYSEDVADLEEKIDGDTQVDAFAAHTQLDKIKDDLRRQKKELKSEYKEKADELLRQVERLQRRVRKDVDTPVSAATRRSRAKRTKQAPPLLPLSPNSSAPPLESPPIPLPPRTLHEIVCDAGWMIDGECAHLIDVIQESLVDVLLPTSVLYRNILTLIEARLAGPANGQ